MKRYMFYPKIFLIGFIFLLLLGLVACSKHSTPTQPISLPPIVGDWIQAGSDTTPTLSLSIKNDSTFTIQNTDTKDISAEGYYVITNTEITFQNDGKTASADCTLSAAYHFTIDDNILTLEAIQDDLCSSRLIQFSKPWIKD